MGGKEDVVLTVMLDCVRFGHGDTALMAERSPQTRQTEEFREA